MFRGQKFVDIFEIHYQTALVAVFFRYEENLTLALGFMERNFRNDLLLDQFLKQRLNPFLQLLIKSTHGVPVGGEIRRPLESKALCKDLVYIGVIKLGPVC